jgi:hypothetical protein
VWLEEGTDQFRGRLTSVATSPESGADDGVTMAVASSPRDVTDAVSEWLHEFSPDAPKRIDIK